MWTKIQLCLLCAKEDDWKKYISMDAIAREKRKFLMARIRNANTKPERIVRQVLTSLGLRYRLHVKKMPGNPDIVIGKLKLAIFVNGCFWHQHEGCPLQKIPKSNIDYWKPKLQRNVIRQSESIRALNTLGYNVLIYWECETEEPDNLRNKIKEQLEA